MQQLVMLDFYPQINELIRISQYFNQTPQEVVTTRYDYFKRNGQMVQHERDEIKQVPTPPPLDHPHARAIIHAVVRETRTQCLHYLTVEDATQAIACALYRVRYANEDQVAITHKFLSSEQVDLLILDVQEAITHHMLPNPWREWNLYEAQGSIALLGGMDYRVNQFHLHDQYQPQDAQCQTSVELGTVINYIQQQLYQRFGPDGLNIPVRPMIAFAINRNYPLVRFSTNESMPIGLLESFGIYSYELFATQVVGPVMEVFNLTSLFKRLDPSRAYVAEFVTSEILEFYNAESAQNADQRWYEETRISLDRGDWVSEREIRRYRAYEHELRSKPVFVDAINVPDTRSY